jgi:Polysulphide reductase, NrfD
MSTTIKAETAAYHGQPMLKAPVWTWQIPAYFFLGGLAGMSSVIALAGMLVGGSGGMVRTALWTAGIGGLVNAGLLTADLGRPLRFLAMLRVLKLRSPMSVGAWTIAAFGGAAAAAVGVFEWQLAAPSAALARALTVLMALAALLGAVVSVYTGVLLGATAIPAWCTRSVLLPIHFGIAALGSAAGLLELLGHLDPSLNVLGLFVAAVETVVGATVELRRRQPVSRAMREGRSGALLRIGGTLAGPASLALRIGGLRDLAAISFLLGALISRYAWVDVGRASARDPEALLDLQNARR